MFFAYNYAISCDTVNLCLRRQNWVEWCAQGVIGKAVDGLIHLQPRARVLENFEPMKFGDMRIELDEVIRVTNAGVLCADECVVIVRRG